MYITAPLIALTLMACLIWWLGSNAFGRGQTQRWIDNARTHPRLHRWLESNHTEIRAAAHYFEFGGLFLVLYWLWDATGGTRHFHFQTMPTIVIALLSALAAHLDELHQLKSGGRQYRREDFVHSCGGIAVAILIVVVQDVVRTRW